MTFYEAKRLSRQLLLIRMLKSVIIAVPCFCLWEGIRLPWPIGLLLLILWLVLPTFRELVESRRNNTKDKL
jgi:hypothetical protein